MPEILRLIEPVPIDDTLCTGGLVRIEDVGFGARFVVASRQTIYEEEAVEFAVKGKLVLPYDLVWPGLVMTANFMARRAIWPGVRLTFRR